MGQTRRFGENVCKKVLGDKRTIENSFDEMLATLKDNSTGEEQEKEFIDDLYFLKKYGNDAVHSSKVNKSGMDALECLKRAFEVAINYAVYTMGADTDILKLRYDTELLVTGKKSKKTLSEKFKEESSKTSSPTKTEETNIKNQTITEEEIERIDEQMNINNSSEIDINITKVNEPVNIINTPKEITILKANEKNNRIFNIVKIMRKSNKKGRHYKNAIKNHYCRYHDKFKEDNIIKKIKTSFTKKTLNYINKEYGIYLNKHKIRKIERLIRKITPSNSVRIKKENNLKWFDSKLRDFFSQNISSKYSKYKGDYNKIQIDKIYKEDDAKNVIGILDKKVRDMYNIYSKNIKLEGFETLEDDLKSQRKLMIENNEEEIEKYLEIFQNTAQNLENIFLGKKSRNFSRKNYPKF